MHDLVDTFSADLYPDGTKDYGIAKFEVLALTQADPIPVISAPIRLLGFLCTTPNLSFDMGTFWRFG
jgi:hypothetical protein